MAKFVACIPLMITLCYVYAGDKKKSAATLFGRTLASLTQNQPAGRSASVEPVTSQRDVGVTSGEGTSPTPVDSATPSGMYDLAHF